MTEPAPLNYATSRDRKGNPLAIISLICGLLLCVPVLAGLGAIITGALGLKQSRQTGAGRGMAIAGVILGCVNFLVALVLMIGLIAARAEARRIQCMTNLRTIGQAMQLYQQDWRAYYPAQLSDLNPYLSRMMSAGSSLACPEAALGATGGPGTYRYVAPGGRLRMIPNASRHVLLYETPGNHSGRGISVLFADFHVEWISAPVAQKFVNELAAGQNPPPCLAGPSAPPPANQ